MENGNDHQHTVTMTMFIIVVVQWSHTRSSTRKLSVCGRAVESNLHRRSDRLEKLKTSLITCVAVSSRHVLGRIGMDAC